MNVIHNKRYKHRICHKQLQSTLDTEHAETYTQAQSQKSTLMLNLYIGCTILYVQIVTL